MLLKGEIVTKQTVTTLAGTSVDSAPMSAKTHFVALEAVDSDVRYRLRPKADRWTRLDAQDNDTPIPAGAVVVEAVYPGAIIAFRQTSAIGGGSGVPFQSSYIPVLLL